MNPFLNLRTLALRRSCFLLGLSALVSTSLLAQPTSGRPDYFPSPPPDMTPPGLPDNPRSENGRETNTPNVQPRSPLMRGGPSSEILPADLARTDSLGIVEADAPGMDEPFSGIIVDLGTNEVLSMLQALTGKTVLRQQNLPAVRITIDTASNLTRAQAIRLLQSALALNGVGLTKVGDDFIKAVPAAIITSQVPILWEGSTLAATPTQMIYEKIFELDFLTPGEVVPLIQPLMSQGAPLALDKSGVILVTDALINLQRIERVLEVIDAPANLSSEVLLFQLQNVNSADVLRRLQQIQAGPLRRRLENNTSFDADERTNQLIVFTHPSNRAIVEDLVSKMDVDVAPLTSTRVYSIRYATAADVVSIIDQVATGQKEHRNDQQTGAQNAAAARRAALEQAQQEASNAAAAAVRADASNLQFSDFLTLVADERANSIVASGTTSDLRALDSLVDQIDVLLAQVRIEAVIVEVTLSEDDASGISRLGFTYDETVNADGSSFIERSIIPGPLGGISFGDGITWDSIGNLALSVFVDAVDVHGRAEILSAPTIVTTHNREASIVVGERRPIITGTTTSTISEFTSSQVQYQNIGIELNVTPLIGSNNVIQLEVEQMVEDVGDEIEIDGNLQPVIITRQASSFVSVGDGQLVVLGGLQRTRASNNESRFPILGQIPVLDRIFTRKTESEERTEVILFLRPRIIRSADEAHTVTREQINTMESRDRVENYLRSGTFRDMDQDEEDHPDERSGETQDAQIRRGFSK